MKKTFLGIFVLFVASLILFPGLLFAYTGEVIQSYKTPGKFPTGMTFDGENLWLADRKADKLFCINPKNGKVIRSIPSPAYWPTGLAWDGEALWNADVKGGIPLSENYNGVIYRVDPKDGTILKVVQSPTASPHGLCWDGKYLWCVDNASDELIQFSPDDGTTIRSLKSPSVDPRGLTFDGKYLWVSDRIKDEIYMVDPESGCVIIITESPGPYSRGLCYAGENLWSADSEYDKIFKLEIRDEQEYKLSNQRNANITIIHQLTNFGPGNAKDVDIHIAIPVDRPSQKINAAITYSPKPTDIIADKWGQETAHFEFKNIPSGEVREAEMFVNASIYDIRYFLFPDKIGSLEEIPSEITSLYLENNEKYGIDHPVIQNAVKNVVGDEKNPYWIARKIFNYLIDNMYYEMVGGWNTAPTVLERGNGSCSEYSFVYIAMCRAAGLPARYVGSVVVRGDDSSFDDVFHRWVEIYLPSYGWVPVDPSGGDRFSPRDQANYFGHIANRFLITTESGGGSETMGWTYNSNDFQITEPKTFLIFDRFADWEPIE